MATVALYGAGAMGEALLTGLLADGRDAADVVITERRAERAEELRERHGVRVLEPAAAAREADVVLVVVKPHDVLPLLGEIAQDLREDVLVLSFAAGVTTATLMADLNQLWMCGLPGYGPGDLIDLSFSEESIDVTFSAGIDRPLRLTSTEATALLVALRSLTSMPGMVDPSAAQRAIAKIETAAGSAARRGHCFST